MSQSLCIHRVSTTVISHTGRGCTLGGNFNFVKDRKSVVFGVWAAPGAAQTPTMTDFRSLNNLKIL